MASQTNPFSLDELFSRMGIEFPSTSQLNALTPDEWLVFRMLGRGCTNNAIVLQAQFPPSAVINLLLSMEDKLRVGTRSDLVAIAARLIA